MRREPFGRLLRDERGFSLPELITAAAVSIILLGTFGGLMVLALNEQPKVADRSAQIDQGRVAVERITRDLREAYSVEGTSSPSQLSVNTFVRSASCGGGGSLPSSSPAIACRVTFSCTTTSCTRTQANPDGSGAGSAVILVDGTNSSSVFSYAPSALDPSHVTVTLSFPNPQGGESVSVSGGAELRNSS